MRENERIKGVVKRRWRRGSTISLLSFSYFLSNFFFASEDMGLKGKSKENHGRTTCRCWRRFWHHQQQQQEQSHHHLLQWVVVCLSLRETCSRDCIPSESSEPKRLYVWWSNSSNKCMKHREEVTWSCTCCLLFFLFLPSLLSPSLSYSLLFLLLLNLWCDERKI